MAKDERLQDIVRTSGVLGMLTNPQIDTSPSDSSDDETPENTITIGELCKVKKLFEGPRKCECCINWVEDPPDNLRDSIDRSSESRRHALLVRMARNHSEGRPLTLHSIVVQSPHIKSALDELFRGYDGITTTLRKLVFRAPFWPFFYEWDRLQRLVDRVEDPVKDHVQLLYQTLRGELKETLSVSKDLVQNNVVTFEYLWTIFPAGIDVYAAENGHDGIYRVIKCAYGNYKDCQFLSVTAHNIESDGKTFGYDEVTLAIMAFPGTKPIAELDVFPMAQHPRHDEVKEHLCRRGRLFVDIHLKSHHYASYEGLVHTSPPTNHEKAVKCNVDGRIIIDPVAHANFNANEQLKLKPLNSHSGRRGLDVSESSHADHANMQSFHWSRPRLASEGIPSQVSQEVSRKKRMQDVPEELHLCSARVRGYSFKIKKWATFYIDLITEIEWNETAFDDLVLAKGYKSMILAFVESHAEDKRAFDDVVKGKGQGIIMLLEGPPGVGKTLTTEAVADRLRRPLYSVSAGELGSTTGSVERALQMILEVASQWDAVLLLDESDVFLERRSANSLARNSIVAVFLRLLEYYRGVLFMTTNRVDAIDPAFQSRIHLTIRYPELNAAARRQVWKGFLSLASSGSGSTTVLLTHLDRLQRLVVNGREIKNLVKSAQLLASHRKAPLDISHIDTVLEISRFRNDGATVWIWRLVEQTVSFLQLLLSWLPGGLYSFDGADSRRNTV